MNFTPLYSKTGRAELIPFIEIISDNMVLGVEFRDRIDDLSMTLDRRKRPKVELTFQFETFNILLNDKLINSADLVIDAFPLDAKVKINLGYYDQFKTYGPFEVIEHNVDLSDGGVHATVFLEGFGVSRHATDFKVYTAGSVFDVIADVYKRNGITLTNAAIKEAQTALKALSVLRQFKETNTSRAITDLLEADADDPFVQIGQSDESFLREICAQYGFSPQISATGGVEFVTLFHTEKGAKIKLTHGVEEPNVTKFSFSSSKIKTTYIRKSPKKPNLSAKVPKKGKKVDAPDAPKDNTSTRVDGSEKKTPKKEKQKELTRQQKLKKKYLAPETKEESLEIDAGTAPSTKDVIVKVPSTKSDNKNRKLGKIIGRKRRSGRVIEIKANLITGSNIPTLGMPVEFDVPSEYHKGAYVIDKINHTFDDEGFSTELELVRPRPKRKKGKKGKKDKKGKTGWSVTKFQNKLANSPPSEDEIRTSKDDQKKATAPLTKQQKLKQTFLTPGEEAGIAGGNEAIDNQTGKATR